MALGTTRDSEQDVVVTALYLTVRPHFLSLHQALGDDLYATHSALIQAFATGTAPVTQVLGILSKLGTSSGHEAVKAQVALRWACHWYVETVKEFVALNELIQSPTGRRAMDRGIVGTIARKRVNAKHGNVDRSIVQTLKLASTATAYYEGLANSHSPDTVGQP